MIQFSSARPLVDMHNLTDLLAGDATLVDALRTPGDLRAADRRLQAIAGTLRLHRVLLMNRQGVCVASNEENPVANLIGVDLADRDYVARALKGERLSQFVVGRVSSVPGFHFAAPVVRNGRVLGVLALKMDLRALAGPLSLSSVIIADAMSPRFSSREALCASASASTARKASMLPWMSERTAMGWAPAVCCSLMKKFEITEADKSQCWLDAVCD